MHVLQIHGTSDATIAYGGGVILGASYPGAVETVEQWAAFASCVVVPDCPITVLGHHSGNIYYFSANQEFRVLAAGKHFGRTA